MLANVMMALIADFMLVWLPAPTLSYKYGLSLLILLTETAWSLPPLQLIITVKALSCQADLVCPQKLYPHVLWLPPNDLRFPCAMRYVCNIRWTCMSELA